MIRCKSVSFWRMKEPDKEVGPGKHGKTCRWIWRMIREKWRDRNSDSAAKSWTQIVHFCCWLTQVNLHFTANKESDFLFLCHSRWQYHWRLTVVTEPGYIMSTVFKIYMYCKLLCKWKFKTIIIANDMPMWRNDNRLLVSWNNHWAHTTHKW